MQREWHKCKILHTNLCQPGVGTLPVVYACVEDNGHSLRVLFTAVTGAVVCGGLTYRAAQGAEIL